MAHWKRQMSSDPKAARREKELEELERSQQRLGAIANGGFGNGGIDEIGLSFGGQLQTSRGEHVDAAHDAARGFRYQQQAVIGEDLASATGRSNAEFPAATWEFVRVSSA